MGEPRKLYRSRSHRQVAGVCGGLPSTSTWTFSAARPQATGPLSAPARAGGWRLGVLDVQRRATTQVRLLLPLTAGDDRS
jgi:PspC domain